MTNAHPHFDDRGTLNWHTRLAEALAEAKAQGKLVLIEMGRELWGQCRSLVEGVLPHPEIAPLAQAKLVALASDCDAPEDAVIAYAQQLEDAYMLPFVMFVDGDGTFVSGSSGAVNPLSFKKTLEALPDPA